VGANHQYHRPETKNKLWIVHTAPLKRTHNGNEPVTFDNHIDHSAANLVAFIIDALSPTNGNFDL
jgi:hypothetical protein